MLKVVINSTIYNAVSRYNILYLRIATLTGAQCIEQSCIWNVPSSNLGRTMLCTH
jgi:hypothetical protein